MEFIRPGSRLKRGEHRLNELVVFYRYHLGQPAGLADVCERLSMVEAKAQRDLRRLCRRGLVVDRGRLYTPTERKRGR